MSKPSFDGTQPELRTSAGDENSTRLNRELSFLHQEIRIDFDQRISNLSTLMTKFRALMVKDIRLLNAANQDNKKLTAVSSDIPILTKKVDDATLADSEVINTKNTIDKQDSVDKPTPGQLAVMRETARFEAGLYQLNCQLFRFRLELDQELEYREEPLHIHFSEQSELSHVLQQITQQKKLKQEQDSKH